MLRRVLASSRYVVLIAVVGTFVASCVLLVYEALVIAALTLFLFLKKRAKVD